MNEPELQVRVVVADMKSGRVVHDVTGNHNSAPFRQWMGKTAFWAMRHQHSMSTAPVLASNSEAS